MSIQSEITRIAGNIEDAFEEINSKGGTVPSNANSDDLASAIATIPSGGTANLITKTVTANGTYTASSDNADGYSSVTVNVSGSGEAFSYVKTVKGATDKTGTFSIKTEALPEYIEYTIYDYVDGQDPDYSVSGTFDFRNATRGDKGYLAVSDVDEYGAYCYLYADRSQYGLAFELWYGEDEVSATTAPNDALTVTVYSNQPQYQPITPSDGFWKIKGGRLIDENGEDIIVNGIGMRANDFNDSVESRRGNPATWEITSATVQEIADIGFNCIRLYFGYQLLEDDNNPGVYKTAGWNWLDTIAGYCEDAGIKIILNLHSPQGGTQYTADGEDLWDYPANQTRVINMWQAIADRYKNNTTFIGWGLINELHLKYTDDTFSATNVRYSTFIQNIIDAIREVDTNHIIVAERALWFYSTDYPWSTTRWNVNENYVYYPLIADSNMVCEYHFFDGNSSKSDPPYTKEQIGISMEKINNLFRRLFGDDVHIYIGEFSDHLSYDSSDDADALNWDNNVLDVVKERRYSHNYHTYYGVNNGSTITALRYVTSWHADAMTGTLYQPLADIFSDPLVDTSDANATSNTILSGYSGYVNGLKVNGSIQIYAGEIS